MKPNQLAATVLIPNKQLWLTTLAILLVVFPVAAGSPQKLQSRIRPGTAPTNTVIATVTVGNGPQALVLSPDNTLLYVANYTDGTISVIDTTTNMVVGSPYSAGSNPESIAVTSGGTQLYIANNNLAGTVTVLNASTGALINTVAVGANPLHLAVTPNGKQVWVPNSETGTVSVIDTTNQTVTSSISIGVSPSCVAFAPNGKTAYVTDLSLFHVNLVDTSTQKISSFLAMDGRFFLVVNPTGANEVYARGEQGIEPIENSKELPAACTPFGLVEPGGDFLGNPAVTPNGKYLYVPQTYSGVGTAGDEVAVVDTKTYQNVGSFIEVGNEPAWVVISSKGNLAYVTNYEDNTVSVIQITPAQ
jgi:YVTN family beta-propeller protein